MQACSLTRQASSTRAIAPLRAYTRLPACPASVKRTQRSAVVTRAGTIQKLTGEELEVAIGDRTTHLVVDFFATWCGPCVLLANELEKVAAELGDQVRIVKVDVDENQDLASQLKIEGLPTMVFIPKDANKPALRTEGLLPYAQILDIVRDLGKE